MIKKLVVFVLFCIAFIVAQPPDTDELLRRIARFAPTEITADLRGLPQSEVLCLRELIQVAKLFNPLYQQQIFSKNLDVQQFLRNNATSEYGKAVLKFYEINMSPWSEMDGGERFTRPIPGINVPEHQPETANYYPEDMTQKEFLDWVATLPEPEQKKAKGYFWLVRRDANGKLKLVPYSQEYRVILELASRRLDAAAGHTRNPSLKKYLSALSKSLLADDYYKSDLAWLDLDSEIEAVIGPYETYLDKLFGYKAAFEAYIHIVNKNETEKLQLLKDNLQLLEHNLPMEDRYRRKLGGGDKIRVVDEVFSGGEAYKGVQAAAYNLPNDPRVIIEKGSKRVMMRNIQLAKFNKILTPISSRLIDPDQHEERSFYAFFTHVVLHELAHGLGPHKGVRETLQELYAPIEEAKADISGLWGLHFLMDRNILDPQYARSIYSTFLASSFRSMRFGINQAHGKGQALQFNYLLEKGAIEYNSSTKRFKINHDKVRSAVTDLAREILNLQGELNKEKARILLEKYAVLTPLLKEALDRLTDIPVDIRPIFTLGQ